jgi:hypothetical protein
MDKAKIRLSTKEMELVANADWILTKNAIIEKTKILFGELQEIMTESFRLIATSDFIRVSPKISKGENYRGLPYLILDYPRIFDKENIFAIRTMFWWGNFFSITLHMAGSYKKQHEEKCRQAYAVFRDSDFFICINKEQWEHHFDPSNYAIAKNLSQTEWEKIIIENSFIKIANKHSLHHWDDAINKLAVDFKVLTDVILS